MSSRPWALIILNQPLSRRLLDVLWSSCVWRACADGGANRLYDSLSLHERRLYIPDLVKGDLDSLRADVRSYYSSMNVSIEKDGDPNSTDLMKCVASLKELEESAGSTMHNILFLGGIGGRLDQTMHTLSYLHKQRQVRTRMMVINDDCLAWVLNEGEHTIAVDSCVLGKTCGILPVGVKSARLTLRGFEWNLEDRESSFDGLMSTSNHVIEDRVYIKTSAPVCWTISVKGFDEQVEDSRMMAPSLYHKAISWLRIT